MVFFPPFDHPCHLTDSLPPTPGLQKIYGIVIDLIFLKNRDNANFEIKVNLLITVLMLFSLYFTHI